MTRLVCGVLLAVAGLAAGAAPVVAHITPPVVLVSDRDALVSLLAGAQRFFVREIRLSPEEVAAIESQTAWKATDDLYRFYLGRDASGRLVAASIFVSEYTIHGPLRVAVGLGPDGRVRGATVVELTEETYGWVKPLLDRQFTQQFVGQSATAPVSLPAGLDQMPQFYGQLIASLVRRAAVLYEVGVMKRGDAR
jgi:hypothetical protein